MTNDPTIREQTYGYFQQEASELLQVLEQELLSLQEDYSINKIHTLMRATHTLKGAAASVGLETIKTVAHSLEDIFKALCKPDLSIDPEVEALLFEAFECLRLPLIAELTGRQVNEAEVKSRTAAVFAQLQEKLGDCFGQESHLPTSLELGFDLTKSIFELGVAQRLDQLAFSLETNNPDEVATMLRTQAEVFLGLAESLNLPGFGAIATAALAALDSAPNQAVTIARTALSDFQAGQRAVLNGDRTQGGQPSLALQELVEMGKNASLPTSSTEIVVYGAHRAVVGSHDDMKGIEEEGETGTKHEENFPDVTPIPDVETRFHNASLQATQPELNGVTSGATTQGRPYNESRDVACNVFTPELDYSELLPGRSQNQESANSLLEVIWGGEAVLDSQTFDLGSVAPAGSTSVEAGLPIGLRREDASKPGPTSFGENVETLHATSLQTDSAALASISNEGSMDVSVVALTPQELAQMSAVTGAWSPMEPEITPRTPTTQHLPTESAPTPIPQKEQVSQSRIGAFGAFVRSEAAPNAQTPTVRVNVEHLEHLSYSVGELLTNQNRQSLQNEQLQSCVRTLLARIQQHQQLLGQLQDWSDRLFVSKQRRTVKRLPFSNLNVESSNLPYPTPWEPPTDAKEEPARCGGNPRCSDWRRVSTDGKDTPPQPSTVQQGHATTTPFDRFDSLELDRYSESQLLVQSLLEDTVQLAEAADAIELFARQSHHTLEKQRRLLTSTRDALMEARMLPLGDIFGRFYRVLQQLENLYKKPVALELGGTEVLVDKVVVEKLYDPLLHLVRNAFDHGIESPVVRQQRGKPKLGKIEITAYHRGRFLVIEVRDDGQGLNFEKIRAQAVERQLVSPERASSFSEAQLTDLLFEPGFSTASEVNDLSGRGVGLDVVRSQLQTLQGSVAVYSQPQRGTTFVLQIPLNLTIAKLLLIQAGDRIYALLADAVEQILIPQAHQLRSWEGGKVLRWDKGTSEQLIPVHRLADVVNYFSGVPETLVSQPKPAFVHKGQMMPIILIRSGNKLLGLEVDQLLGEQELVIRPLGAMIVPPDYVYGGSILADGRLTLVLDGAALIQYAFDRQTRGSTNSLPVEQRHSFAFGDLASSTPPILPSSKEQPRQLPEKTSAITASPHPDSTRPNKLVLIVDDSITLRQTLALTLQKAGYQVLQAKDGYEAILALQQSTDIQLVLCDIEMPRMNGFEFLKYRQQDRDLADVPVVLLTSRSGEKHRLIASELGATAYITKPFLENKLLGTLKDVLEKNILNSVSV